VSSGSSVTLAGATRATGNVNVNATLIIGGQTLTVGGNLGTNTLGHRFTMTNAADRVLVAGNVKFGGGGGNGRFL